METWETYQSRINARGSNKRNAALIRETRLLNMKAKNTLSYHTVSIGDETHTVSIINSDNLDEKIMLSLPGEDFRCGDLVEWMNNRWLIVEKDANNEVYTRVKLEQCNYLLRWVDDLDVIHEQWCVISDGTKLKRASPARDSLAYWKRYVKTTPLIAGISLEPRRQNRRMKYA